MTPNHHVPSAAAMRRCGRSAFCTLTLCLLAASLDAAPPRLDQSSPLGLAPGKATVLTLRGDGLEDVRSCWTSAPASTEILTADKAGKRSLRVRVTLDRSVDESCFALRVATPEGPSNLLLLAVDELPSIGDSADNASRDKAQAIEPPVAIDGHSNEKHFEWFRFEAHAGQRLAVEALAQGIGSALDPVVRLLDAEGEELVYSDDAIGVGSDSRFAWTCAEDGEYFLELRDINYAGGPSHPFRLRVGDFPLVTSTFPIGLSVGGKTGKRAQRVEVLGPEAVHWPSVEVPLPKDKDGDGDGDGARAKLAFRPPSASSCAPISLLASTLPMHLESEPNDAPDSAEAVRLPTAIEGRFLLERDRDVYAIQLEKGSRWLFRGITRSVGSPADLYLRLLHEDGSEITHVEDSGSREGVVDFKVPAKGRYLLAVEDLHRRGGRELVYRIEAEPWRPDFSLRLEDDDFDAPRDGVLAIKVLCGREGWDGPVDLSIEPAGFEVLAGRIEKGKKDGLLRARLPAGLEEGALTELRVVGTAKIGTTNRRRVASTLDALRKKLPRMPRPPAALDGRVALGVRPPFPEFLELDRTDEPILVSRTKASAAFRVLVRRLNKDFKDPIDLSFEDLPSGVQVEPARIEKNRRDVVASVKLSDAVRPGDHTFTLTARSTFRHQPGVSRREGLVLRIVEPLSVVLVPPARLKPGEKAKLRIVLSRLASYDAPVTLQWNRPPRALVLPEKIELKEDADEAVVEIQAAADALPGSLHALGVIATAKGASGELRVESPSVHVEIEKP